MVLRLARRNLMASTRNEIEAQAGQRDHDRTVPARSRLCAVCERAPGQVAAVLDGEDVVVCPECYQYETGEGQGTPNEAEHLASALAALRAPAWAVRP